MGLQWPLQAFGCSTIKPSKPLHRERGYIVYIQQDWLIRQIEMILSFITQMLFGKSHENSAAVEDTRQTLSAELTQRLTALLQEKRLGEAEDLLFQHLDGEDTSLLATAVDFYQQANALTDAELESQGFTREELLEGLSQVAERYGLYLPGFWGGPAEP